MGMRYEGDQAGREFAAAFGFSTEDITPAQAAVLVKMIKHARLRCRSNNALYPYLGRIFPNLVFKDEEKQNPPGSKYATRKSLTIKQRVKKVPKPDPALMKPDDVTDDEDDDKE